MLDIHHPQHYTALQSVYIRTRTTARMHMHAHRNMLFHGNNGFVEARHCYVQRTLPILFKLNIRNIIV